MRKSSIDTFTIIRYFSSKLKMKNFNTIIQNDKKRNFVERYFTKYYFVGKKITDKNFIHKKVRRMKYVWD